MLRAILDDGLLTVLESDFYISYLGKQNVIWMPIKVADVLFIATSSCKSLDDLPTFMTPSLQLCKQGW